MNSFLRVLVFLLPLFSFAQKQTGFIDFSWNDDSGEVQLHIPTSMVDVPFLYVNSLAAGVGSNDIGLDRGQLGDTRVVRFYRSGNKMLLIEDNLKYRAMSDNEAEVNAVEEAFAKSVLFGFDIVGKSGGAYQLNANPFLLRDAHGVIGSLKETGQGDFDLDSSKSAIYKEGLFNFPDNTELEAIITFQGRKPGSQVRSVTPTPSLVSVRMHHSFVRLPDDKYTPRNFHPESGYFYNSFYDYASSIGEDMQQRFIRRHRLEKKNPRSERSEAVEPIVYYIDSGCPEPVKSALMEGGSWWNQAFEYAGFKDAFQVKELPEGAHPLDVRYNMIQWVHRSTRGWSYGASVADPRTGEILKGHVSLGSLRVRQDFMIAQGIISAYDENSDDPRMLQMALARLRQLSAHEIGHTIGLAHNFAASYNDRASVMDYPHPLVIMDGEDLDFSKAYDDKIGEWDKRAIAYGYGSPKAGESEIKYLERIISRNKKDGFLFISDKDARPAGGMHPFAHLWDNGNDPVSELERLIAMRKKVLANLGSNSIQNGTPYSEIEKVLVPAYLMHRYQVDAASKIIGGMRYEYSVKPNPVNFEVLPVEQQQRALNAILSTLDIEFLKFPDQLLSKMPPSALGYNRTRESFKGTTGALFDPISAAEASASHSLKFLLHPERLARLNLHAKSNWNLNSYLNQISQHIRRGGGDAAYQLMLEKIYFIHLLKLKNDKGIDKQVLALVESSMSDFLVMKKNGKISDERAAHLGYLRGLLFESNKSPETFVIPEVSKLPPGSPIGCH